jgi:putative two-component system response regulator
LKKRLLFIDDDRSMLDALQRALHGQSLVWDGVYMTDPNEAWLKLLEGGFDAVICDVKIPGLSGLELLDRIRSTPQICDTPVLILTGAPDRALKRQAFDLGATDHLDKPVDPEDLLARLRNILRMKSYQDQLKASNRWLEQTVLERTEELFHSRLDIIWRLGKAAEHRDESTGNHVVRVGCMSRVIAENMGLNRHLVEILFLAAPLHDIGKIGIPDAILQKRGPLNLGEWAVMKQHCHVGARILSEDSHIRSTYFRWRGNQRRSNKPMFDNPFLEMAASIALTHHEKWDGGGYPQGLAGENIPLESRIVAIADVFDALTSRRPYKDASSEFDSLQIISRAAGKHFDPAVHEAFCQSMPEIQSIREQFPDFPESTYSEMDKTREELDLAYR